MKTVKGLIIGIALTFISYGAIAGLITNDRAGFGASVCISNGQILIGGTEPASSSGTYDGRSFLYSFAGNLLATYSTTGVAGTDEFGWDVSMAGTTVAIGARDYNQSAGSAYIFNSSGSLISALSEPAGGTGYFGASVSAYSDGTISRVLVTALGSANGPGNAYIYDASDGSLLRTITYTGASSDAFGTSACLYKDASTGSLYAKIGAGGEGVVYTYNVSNGNLMGVLNPGLPADSGFGISLSISGNMTAVGAVGTNDNTGSAYLYTTGQTTRTLVASDGASGDTFGTSIAVAGSSVMVGSPNAALAGGVRGGAVYVFSAASGAQTLKITPSGTAMQFNFGGSVSLDSSGNFAIGAEVASSVYVGNLNSMTTLDDGSTQTISNVDFSSNVNWIIGKSTSGNKVSVDVASVATLASGLDVYIGQTAGSNNNRLILNGDGVQGAPAATITADVISVGAIGNSGNALVCEMYAQQYSKFNQVLLYKNNSLFMDLELTSEVLVEYFFRGTLAVYDETIGGAVILTEENCAQYLVASSATMEVYTGTLFTAVPEPASFAAIFGAIAIGFIVYRRRSRK